MGAKRQYGAADFARCLSVGCENADWGCVLVGCFFGGGYGGGGEARRQGKRRC